MDRHLRNETPCSGEAKPAAQLLTRSHWRIGEIAAMLHFCDDNNFSSAFKKYHGMTPREYRKKISS